MPQSTWLSEQMICGMTHHRYNNEFVTCGARVLLWDASMKSPKASYDWNPSQHANSSTITCVSFNEVEHNMFASCDSVNHIVLYDIRAKDVKKLRMKHKVNAMMWNPMEPMMLTCGSNDYNSYTFDIRNFDTDKRIVMIHEGHTKAVTSVYYSPTGKELITGSDDKSLRIFEMEDGKCRDVYHT